MGACGDANALLAEIAEVGCDPERGGYTRPVFSPAELRLRTWFTTHATERGLDVETDRNGIMWAWWDPTPAHGEPAAEPGRRCDAIVTGSHLDSVPGGGNLDGPLGVASALAAVDLLRYRGVQPVRPLGIAVFPEEEGSRFGVACLGSRLLAGILDPEEVRGTTDDTGRTFAEVCADIGFDPDRIGADPARIASISAFVELHVEQGRGLADLGRPVALAGAILAHGRWHLRIEGRGDHAGATRMADRHDPVVVASAVIQSVRRHATGERDARGTVGRIKVVPGGTNVIASAVDLWIDVRHRAEEVVQRIVDEVRDDAIRAAEAEGCTVALTEQSFSPTVDFDANLRGAMQAVLPDAPVLDTGAGHDAGVLASVIPTGMLFVRNPTGASHTPAEHAEPADIAAGVEALTGVLAHLLTR
ncbi:allantoate amidohydrolase [Microbacterium mangrovi]|uniref:Allantoate amidohydrolase n=1 Tax=Microbacterium mangrovi TaxID=1348253 RepID=A0A0B2A156_9MICO|nr:allantoate amidohydrolase [Microbacterium mangrovi]KHK95552.1 allantoate amidohydrolase [Microbacterium mangrovi]